MMTEHDYPILEFDDNKKAKLNPSSCEVGRFDTDKLIITFFPEVINNLLNHNHIKLEYVINGENPVCIYYFIDDPDILITLGRVGCPACGGNLDLLNEMGITKVMFCGGGGVLDKDIKVGQLLLVDGAIRDEGFSFHYLPPSRIVNTDPETTDKIAKYLDKNDIPYLRGLTWTTDALFRETDDRIKKRKEEGAKIVEMEQAGCIAVSIFRGFKYGALIYGGDDVSGEEWSNRNWRSRDGIRTNLVSLCKELLYIM